LVRNAISHFEPGRFNLRKVGGERSQLGISPHHLDLTADECGSVKALYLDGIRKAAEEFLTTAQGLAAALMVAVATFGLTAARCASRMAKSD